MKNFFKFYKLLYESAFPSDPKELERILKKSIPNISPLDCSNQVKELIKLKDNRTKINCFEWMKKGVVRLPEDLPKVELALKIAKNKGINPQEFKYPQELINKYSTFSQGAELINPDEIPEFSKKEKRENNITVYTVEDSPEGQLAVRRILNNNYGEDFNPWCLAYGNGHGGVSSQAREYWKYYNDFPKKIAFKNGKAIAFNADHNVVVDLPLYVNEYEAEKKAKDRLEHIIKDLLNCDPAYWPIPKESSKNFTSNYIDFKIPYEDEYEARKKYHLKEQNFYAFANFYVLNKVNKGMYGDHDFMSIDFNETLRSVLDLTENSILKDKIKEILKFKYPYIFFRYKLPDKKRNEILKLAKNEWNKILKEEEKNLEVVLKLKHFIKMILNGKINSFQKIILIEFHIFHLLAFLIIVIKTMVIFSTLELQMMKVVGGI